MDGIQERVGEMLSSFKRRYKEQKFCILSQEREKTAKQPEGIPGDLGGRRGNFQSPGRRERETTLGGE